MDSDDLDNLIADSLGGVQSALEGERKAAQPAAAEKEWAKEAVRELKDGSKPEGANGQPPGEDFFCNLVKTFQDEEFQKTMADALSGKPPLEAAALAPEAPADAEGATPAPASGSTAPATSSTSGGGGDQAEEFLQGFLKSFDQAVGQDGNFEKGLTSLMTSMLSNDLICEPLQQIVEKLEPYLKSQKNLPQADRTRYENQLRLYKQILSVYSSSSDPLPDAAREEVQRLLTELHSYGQPPDEVMQQVAPKDAAEGDESFEDFVKSMGLDGNLGSAEQDLLKKLTEDPEELTKVMKDMAQGLPDEACKQQ